jgi:hypothetical protein
VLKRGARSTRRARNNRREARRRPPSNHAAHRDGRSSFGPECALPSEEAFSLFVSRSPQFDHISSDDSGEARLPVDVSGLVAARVASSESYGPRPYRIATSTCSVTRGRRLRNLVGTQAQFLIVGCACLEVVQNGALATWRRTLLPFHRPHPVGSGADVRDFAAPLCSGRCRLNASVRQSSCVTDRQKDL